MMSIGFGQILLILVLVFIIFGAGRLPSVMADLAKGMRAFKKGMTDEDEITPTSTKDQPVLVQQDDNVSPQKITKDS